MIADGCGETGIRDAVVKIVEEAGDTGGISDYSETFTPICGGKGGPWEGNENCREGEDSKTYENHVNSKFGEGRKI